MTSKELEALESLIEKFSKVVMNATSIPQTKNSIKKCVDYTNQCFKDEINILKSALERKEKLEKVWEIIKEKKVNVGLLSRCANVERYNKGICYEPRHLTQEEFELLKEWLENDTKRN